MNSFDHHNKNASLKDQSFQLMYTTVHTEAIPTSQGTDNLLISLREACKIKLFYQLTMRSLLEDKIPKREETFRPIPESTPCP